jgi:divalent metal cation (Fe/Co/Zn/Cd) transporter
MARLSFTIGKKIKSDVLIADAWHHRSDVFASIAVGIGIIASTFGYPFLDAIFGTIVSFIIIYVGFTLAKSSSNLLIGQAPDKELIKQIKNIAKTTKNVKGIHDLSLHDYGATKILTLHAEINSNLQVNEAHKIADELEKKILFRTNFSTIIHIDPSSIQENIEEKRKLIRAILEKQKEIKSFHKITIIQSKNKDIIKMHLVVDKDMSINESHELSEKLISLFKKQYGHCEIDIHFDPCDNNCKLCKISCSKRTK